MILGSRLFKVKLSRLSKVRYEVSACEALTGHGAKIKCHAVAIQSLVLALSKSGNVTSINHW